MHNKLIFLLPAILLLVVPNVYAGGPRLDAGEDLTNEQADCYVSGYDAGVANKFNEDRDQECKNLGMDQYSYGWVIGCKYSENPGTTEECENRINDAESTDSVSLKEANIQDCYDSGYDGGQNNPYDQDKGRSCSEYGGSYHQGFIDGCIAADNTKETCERFTDQ